MAPGVGGSVCTVGGTEALRTSLRYRTAAIRLASALGYAPQGSMACSASASAMTLQPPQ